MPVGPGDGIAVGAIVPASIAGLFVADPKLPLPIAIPLLLLCTAIRSRCSLFRHRNPGRAPA
jgi:hypothetical protein